MLSTPVRGMLACSAVLALSLGPGARAGALGRAALPAPDAPASAAQPSPASQRPAAESPAPQPPPAQTPAPQPPPAGVFTPPALPPGATSPADRAAHETFVRVCTKCHPAERVISEGRSQTQWENTIISMQTSRGATITPEEFDIVLDYLTRFHGRDSAAQAPAAPGPGGRGAVPPGPRANVGAADRHRVDPAGAERGRKIYASECVTCHGANARGTERGANLIRSTRVLRDRYGSAIGPYLKKGHPMQTGAPSSALSDQQVTDIAHFLWDRINNTLRGSPEFDVKNVLTGDPQAGQAYFFGAGGCSACHSPTGDLAGYGTRYEPVEIQQRFVFPSAAGRGRGRGGARPQTKATVTLPDGRSVSGVLVSSDDFHVALRDESGEYRSWPRTPAVKIQKTDPYAAHVALLDRLTDEAMHDVVAYLEKLK
jgi:mono/diheme cytochrome c family protein